MENKLLHFPGVRVEVDDNPLGLTEEQLKTARENLARHSAEQRAREAAHRGDAREISLTAFAARVEYQARKNQPTQNAEGVRVGDLFYGSWGYEQTNVDFFEVVALRGKHTAVLRKIAGDYVGGFAMQGNICPCRGEYIREETYTVRTKTAKWHGEPRLMINHPTASGHTLSPTTDDRELGYSSYY